MSLVEDEVVEAGTKSEPPKSGKEGKICSSNTSPGPSFFALPTQTVPHTHCGRST